ncbi:MAG: hypothetical protein JWO22_3226 [Frankiales bacterium]|nr:hypothetical protein [Frankiales bacterium]
MLIAQGALLSVLAVALGVWLLLQPTTHGEEALGLVILLFLDVGVLFLSLIVGGTGLASRGPGLVAPAFGVLAHSLLSLLALFLLGTGAWFIGIEVIPVELGVIFCFWLGVPWWRQTARVLGPS